MECRRHTAAPGVQTRCATNRALREGRERGKERRTSFRPIPTTKPTSRRPRRRSGLALPRVRGRRACGSGGNGRAPGWERRGRGPRDRGACRGTNVGAGRTSERLGPSVRPRRCPRVVVLCAPSEWGGWGKLDLVLIANAIIVCAILLALHFC